MTRPTHSPHPDPPERGPRARRRRWRDAWLAAALLAWLAPAPFASPAQPVSEAQVKAAFLLQFPKFVDWPAESFSPDGPFVLCVSGEGVLWNELRVLGAGKSISGRALELRLVRAAEDYDRCHLLYFAPDSARGRVPPALARAPVLTVGDRPSFAMSDGGVIALVTQADRVGFEINVAAAERAHLRVSSKLLALARNVWRTP